MHKGMSVIEVLQNCVIFNDKTHAAFAADKATRAERTITLRHGGKMLFGANMEKGIVFEDMKLKVVTVGQDGYTLDDVLTHDAHERDTTLHSMLAAMKYPEYPVALGVIRAVEDATVYDREVARQVEKVKAQSKIRSVDELLHSGATWEIESLTRHDTDPGGIPAYGKAGARSAGFFLGAGQTNGTPEEGLPGGLQYAPACRYESPPDSGDACENAETAL